MPHREKYLELDKFIEERGGSQLELISILHRAQEIFGYISQETQEYIGRKLDLSPAKVYGVVTFYNYFTLEPRGKHKVVVCTGTACHINGSALLLEKLKEILKIDENEVTEDRLFSLETARCLGACALSPIIKIDEKIYSRVKPEMLETILSEYRVGKNEEIKSEETEKKAIDKVHEKKVLQKKNVEYTVRIANSTCAISSGAEKVIESFEKLEKNENVSNFKTVKVGCMGFCYCEPTIEIESSSGESIFFGNVNGEIAQEIGEVLNGNSVERNFEISLEEKLEKFSSYRIYPRELEVRVALEHCGKIDPMDIDSSVSYGSYEALKKVLKEYSPEEVIEIIKKSGLRGRGGAGYPTGLKWDICRKNPGDEKYIVCNGDEGDPGAFMDRVILESDPHQVLEAMAIAGYAIGAKRGIIYVRIEYPLAVKTLKVAIAQAESRGFLGKNIFGGDFFFNIEIRLGAGAFVCGEETALIHSMEGKRGEPTVKPPYPGERGYLGYPTNVNNVETFAHVSKIINHGYEWYRGIGTENSPGTKVFALVGKIERTGLVEVPMGVALKDIIYTVGGGLKNGKKFKAVQTGGPSGGSLSESELDLKLDYENLISAGTMMGSGGMIVMDEHDNMVEVAKFYLDFSRSESCGKCSPCRIGTTKLYELLNDFTKGKGSLEKLHLLEELGNTVKRASLCGLGRSAPNPLLSTIKKFRNEYLKGCVK